MKEYSFGHFIAENYVKEEGEGIFGDKGSSKITIDLKKFEEIKYPTNIFFEVLVQNSEGKEFERRIFSKFFPGKKIAGIKIPYHNNAVEEINAEIILVDNSGKPCNGTVDIEIYKREYRWEKYYMKKIREVKEIKVERKIEYPFKILVPGEYVFQVKTRDEDGRDCFTSDIFFVNREPEKEWKIDVEKREYEIGEKAKINIEPPEKGLVLIAVEKENLLEHFVMNLTEKSTLELEIKKDYFPKVVIHIIAISGKEHYFTFFPLDIKSNHKKLYLDIKCENEVPPSSKTKIQLRVKDSSNKGKKARIFLYCVDEGVLSLTGYEAPDPYNLYYRFIYFNCLYKPVFSCFYKKFSFKRPLMDIDFQNKSIFGKVMYPDGSPFRNAEIILEKKGKPAKTTFTSEEGYYGFDNLSPGEYTIRIKAEGYNAEYFLKNISEEEEEEEEEEESMSWGTIIDNRFEVNVVSDQKLERDIVMLPKILWGRGIFYGGVMKQMKMGMLRLRLKLPIGFPLIE